MHSPMSPHTPHTPQNAIVAVADNSVETVLPSTGDLPQIQYGVLVSTSNSTAAGTDKPVYVRLLGDLAHTEILPLNLENSSSSPSSSDCFETHEEIKTSTSSSALCFPASSVREFSLRALDVGNIISIIVYHASDDDETGAWNPERIVVRNEMLHRTWTFICTRWLSLAMGNQIELFPAGDIAVGRRASRRASRRISDGKEIGLLSSCNHGGRDNESRTRFESVRERFNEAAALAANPFSNGNEVGTRRVLFQLQKFITTASRMYLVGSIPALGEWRPEHACRMTQHSGFDGCWRGEWRLQLEIDDDFDEIQYKYMIVSESEAPGSRVATFTEPLRVLKLSGADAIDRHAEGGPIHVKDVFRYGNESRPLGSSPYIPHPRHSASMINTPNGRARLLGGELTPHRSWPRQSSHSQSMLNNELEESVHEPTSETSTSRSKRTVSSLATEESSIPQEECQSNDGSVDQFKTPNSSSYRRWSEEMDIGTDESSVSERSHRRQSNEASYDSMSPHGRGDQRGSQDFNGRSPSTPDDYSPVSSDYNNDGPIEGDAAMLSLRDKVKHLRHEQAGLQTKLQTLERERSLHHTELEQVQKRFNSAMAESTSFQSKHEDILNELKLVRAQRDADAVELEALRTQLDCAMSERDKTNEESALLKAEHSNAREELVSVRALFEKLEAERDALGLQARGEMPEVEACRRESDAAKAELARIVEERNRLKGERDSLEIENKSLVNQLDQHAQKSETFDELSIAHQGVLEELSEVRNVVVKKQEEIDTQSTHLQNLLLQKQQAFDTEVASLKAEQSVLHDCWAREFKERRKLFNTIQELRGNIRVFCRVRPSKQRSGRVSMSFPDANLGEHGRVQLNGKLFEFDHVFQPSSTQKQVYDETAAVVTSVVDGYNVCIFAYGQTGSGKTHTMDGTENDRGVNFRALENLFQIANERTNHSNVNISVSMLEIYNENLRDLILPEGGTEIAPKLEIRKDLARGTQNAVYVPHLTEVAVASFAETWEVMQQGSLNRSKGRTDMNQHSSRSHLIVRVTVSCENLETGIKSSGILHLVDLAGSERVSRSNASGDRLKEAQHINKSLSSLGDVFAALTNNSAHVPYRNSKLTYLLQDSLGGDSKTLMFVNVSCDDMDSTETQSSLQFAQRVAKVELGSAKKHTERTAEIKATAALSEKEVENRSLLEKVGGLQREMKKRDECIAEMRQRTRGLESDLETAKSSVSELTLKSSHGDAIVKELQGIKMARERDLVELNAVSKRMKEMEMAKDREIRQLQSAVERREKDSVALREKDEEINLLKAQLSSFQRQITEDTDNEGKQKRRVGTIQPKETRVERMASVPVLGVRRVEGESAVRLQRTASTVGRPAKPRSNITDVAGRKSHDGVSSLKAMSTQQPASTGALGPARRAKDGNGGRPRIPSLRPAPVRGNGPTPNGDAMATKPKRTYAFGSRIENPVLEKSGDRPSRLPRSKTAVLRPPQRANNSSLTNDMQMLGLPRTGSATTINSTLGNVRRSGAIPSGVQKSGSSTSSNVKSAK